MNSELLRAALTGDPVAIDIAMWELEIQAYWLGLIP
jgi:hypothetical protein